MQIAPAKLNYPNFDVVFVGEMIVDIVVADYIVVDIAVAGYIAVVVVVAVNVVGDRLLLWLC